MYWWLAEDLAERGYVVITYDVQGQGTSETLPHAERPGERHAVLQPVRRRRRRARQFGCPGVPAQQDSNFVSGTQDALELLPLDAAASAYRSPERGRHARSTRSTRCGS